MLVLYKLMYVIIIIIIIIYKIYTAPYIIWKETALRRFINIIKCKIVLYEHSTHTHTHTYIFIWNISMVSLWRMYTDKLNEASSLQRQWGEMKQEIFFRLYWQLKSCPKHLQPTLVIASLIEALSTYIGRCV